MEQSTGIEKLFPDLFDLFSLQTTSFDDDFKAIRFYSHTKDYSYMSKEGVNHWKEKRVDTKIFSNLYPAEIYIQDKDSHFMGKYDIFASSEHYFQMYKYSDDDRGFMVRLSTNDVASYGQRRMKFQDMHLKILRELKDKQPKMKNGRPYEKNSVSEPQLIIDDWNEKCIDVMYTALRAKFSQHQDLVEMLVATKGCWLIEHTKNDTKWADGINGSGTNYLGKSLMYIRQELIDNKEYEPNRNFLKCQMDKLINYKI